MGPHHLMVVLISLVLAISNATKVDLGAHRSSGKTLVRESKTRRTKQHVSRSLVSHAKFQSVNVFEHGGDKGSIVASERNTTELERTGAKTRKGNKDFDRRKGGKGQKGERKGMKKEREQDKKSKIKKSKKSSSSQTSAPTSNPTLDSTISNSSSPSYFTASSAAPEPNSLPSSGSAITKRPTPKPSHSREFPTMIPNSGDFPTRAPTRTDSPVIPVSKPTTIPTAMTFSPGATNPPTTLPTLNPTSSVTPRPVTKSPTSTGKPTTPGTTNPPTKPAPPTKSPTLDGKPTKPPSLKPSILNPTSAPSPSNSPFSDSIAVELTPFGILYNVTKNEVPTNVDYNEVANLTDSYLKKYFVDFYKQTIFTILDTFDMVFVSYHFTSGQPYSFTPVPILIDFEATGFFGPTSAVIPTVDDLDMLLKKAFIGKNMGVYLAELKTLPTENVFSTTASVEVMNSSSVQSSHQKEVQIEAAGSETTTTNNPKSAFLLSAALAMGACLGFAAVAISFGRKKRASNNGGKPLDNEPRAISEASLTIMGENSSSIDDFSSDDDLRPLKIVYIPEPIGVSESTSSDWGSFVINKRSFALKAEDGTTALFETKGENDDHRLEAEGFQMVEL